MKQKAFTLIELLVVIVIIGLLATIGVGTYKDFKSRARISKSLAFENQFVNSALASTLEQGKKPIVFLDLDEESGSETHDSSANQYSFPGVLESSWTDDTPDGSPSALKSPVTNGLIKTTFDDSDVSGKSELTMSAFIKPLDMTQTSRMACVFGRLSSFYLCMNLDFTPQFFLAAGNSTYSVQGTEKAILGEWNHIAGTYDGEVARVYLNGELVGTKTVSFVLSTQTKLTFPDSESLGPNDYIMDRIRVLPAAVQSGFDR